MRIRDKIFLGFLLAAATTLYFLMSWVRDDVRVRYLESVEENMVDAANILASLAAEHISADKIDTASFAAAFDEVRRRGFSARIYEVSKDSVDSNIYITDSRGIVVFDSAAPENVGEDFSRWRDVARTLRGEYGARATRTNPDDPDSLVMFVSAPIVRDGATFGVLSLYKPVKFVTMFIKKTENRVMGYTLKALAIVALLGIVLSFWITNPIVRLTRYVDILRVGGQAPPPRLGGGEVGTLADSFNEMRQALEGKKYVEEYVANLTHELKNPIAAIQGAIELLSEEGIPERQRTKFLNNIKHENLRTRRVVDRMLRLSRLENASAGLERSRVDIAAVAREIVKSAAPRLARRRINTELPGQPVMLDGDHNLLYDALDNIVGNAIEFTEDDGEISISVEITGGMARITVADNGVGVPEYAMEKIFTKFYSLPRPGNQEKSSGLGLSIAKKVVELHNGAITLANNHGRGVTLTLELPLAS